MSALECCGLTVSVLFWVMLLPSVISRGFRVGLEQCVVSKPAASLRYCLGAGALSHLQSIDNDPMFDVVDGVTLSRDDHQPRSLLNYLERDPNDFGGIIDAMSNIASHRTLRYDMSSLYPGLVMRITPSVNGLLEFVMDPLHENLELKNHYHKEIGTGRLLARHFVLPFLLGFKFKIATLIPIIFGILAIIAKKALFLSKAALVISSSLALGSLLFGSNKLFGHSSGHGHQFGSGSNVYGSHYDHWSPPYHGFKSDDSAGQYTDLLYKGYGQNDELDQLKFTDEREQQPPYERTTNGRNFAWNDSEKEANT